MDMGINPFDCPQIDDTTEMCIFLNSPSTCTTFNIQTDGVLFKEWKFNKIVWIFYLKCHQKHAPNMHMNVWGIDYGEQRHTENLMNKIACQKYN